jgi:hypothetical protein
MDDRGLSRDVPPVGLPYGPKAWLTWGALEQLRHEGMTLSHCNVLCWLACVTPGMTVSERHQQGDGTGG